MESFILILSLFILGVLACTLWYKVETKKIESNERVENKKADKNKKQTKPGFGGK